MPGPVSATSRKISPARPGTRPVRSGPGREAGIALYAPVIVKYRDEKTDIAVRLEDLLR